MKLDSIDPASSVTRVAPAVYIPGGVLRISLVVQPSTEVRALAVEERLPAGVIITRVSDGGYVDVANRAIRWGPFLENTPRTLVYETVSADTTAGPLGLAGVGSFDGRSIVATGPGELREGCGVSVEAASSTGRFRLTLNGRAGARFLIESSADLRTWTPVTQVSKLTEPTAIDDPSVGDRGCRFYRARQTE